jgi:hypothetical protein
MGFGRPSPRGVSSLGSSANTMGYPLNFIFYPSPGVPLIPACTKRRDSGYSESFIEGPEPTPHPMSPVLEPAIPKEMNEAAALSEIYRGPSSVNHVFPFSPQHSPSRESNIDERKHAPEPLSPQQGGPRKCYLHRTPTGKLTEIGPSPLCQEATKILLEEAADAPGNGLILGGHRKFNEDVKGFFALKSGSEHDELSEMDFVTSFSAASEEAEATLGSGLVYAGYRIWNRDPGNFLGFPSVSEQGEPHQTALNTGCNATLKEKEFENGFDAELPPDEFSLDESSISLLLPNDETSNGYASESSSGSCSINRIFPISSKSRGKFEPCQESIELEESATHMLVNYKSLGEMKQPRGQGLTGTIPNESQPLFNPSLKQEVKLNHQLAQRPIPPESRDEARIQFRHRWGALWNMANKDLKELFLHGTLLFESEFLDLVFCQRDVVPRWLDRHGPRLIQRSMQKWIKANDALKKAGIRPCEINEEVRDIFELMTPQEQAKFIKKYQQLFALVKSSQERLHLTASEMEHFRRLSLADKYDFIERHKTRKLDREKIVRRDSDIFTAKLRRTSRDSDELPFADCSSPTSLQSLDGQTSETPRKSANTTVDNLYIKSLQFGMGQEKVGVSDSSSASTIMPSPLFASPMLTRADSKIDSSDEWQQQQRPTAFTGDGRTRLWKHDEAKPTNTKAQPTQVLGLVVKYGTGFGSVENCTSVRELLASAEKETTEIAKETVEIKSFTETQKQYFKQKPSMNNLESKVLDSSVKDCGRVATALFSKILKHQNDHRDDADTEEDDIPEPLRSKLVLVRSPRKERLEVHPGAKVPVPSPPPTEDSAKGVIAPVTFVRPPVGEQPFQNLCFDHILQVATATPIRTGTKSEPGTPGNCGSRDILTKDLEKCRLQVDVLR